MRFRLLNQLGVATLSATTPKYLLKIEPQMLWRWVLVQNLNCIIAMGNFSLVGFPLSPIKILLYLDYNT